MRLHWGRPGRTAGQGGRRHVPEAKEEESFGGQGAEARRGVSGAAAGPGELSPYRAGRAAAGEHVRADRPSDPSAEAFSRRRGAAGCLEARRARSGERVEGVGSHAEAGAGSRARVSTDARGGVGGKRGTRSLELGGFDGRAKGAPCVVLAVWLLSPDSRPGRPSSSSATCQSGYNRGLSGDAAYPAARWPVTSNEPKERTPSLGVPTRPGQPGGGHGLTGRQHSAALTATRPGSQRGHLHAQIRK